MDAEPEALLLADGSRLEGVDTVIYCTGYHFSYPFLPESILKLHENNAVLAPLFAHTAHADYMDSLFFLGLYVDTFLPLALFSLQARVAVSLMTGRLRLSGEEVAAFDIWRRAEMAATGVPGSGYHKMTPHTTFVYADYLYSLCKRAGDGALKPFTPVQRGVFLHVVDQLTHNIAHNKDFEYVVHDDETFTVRKLWQQ